MLAVEKRLNLVRGLPVVLDETRVVKYPELVDQVLYQVPKNHGQARGAGWPSLLPWSTIVISTGEQSALSFTTHQGAAARVLALTRPPFGTGAVDNGQAAINVARGIDDNYGHAGPAFVQQLRATIADPDQVATLRDRWRPTQGGIQIHFGQYLCTMGFNGDDGTQRSFITNSHCTNRQGGVESTEYYQPTSTIDNTVIAVEVEDPTYFKGGACPRGRSCRRSDAARALYSGTESTRGMIAKTSGANNMSLEVTGAFTVTSQDNTTTSFAIGTTVNKVGRTTGWTQGNVTNTCVNTNVSGTRFTQLCQTFVQAPNNAVVVGGGDSGSGVFRITSGSNVQLVGILWGGSSDGRLFVISPLKQIRDEIGPINAVQ